MSQKPNFIVIHSDQQRYDCTGIAGRRKGIYTPYTDSIGYMGANFTSCYSTCPVCMPQRLSLITGQLAETHGIYTNYGIPYLPLETTLPTEMRKGGYETALVGRTMHTYPFNHPYGFEYYLPGDPSSENKETTDPFFKYLRDNNPNDAGGYYGGGPVNNSRAAGPFHLADHFHQTKWATNRALDFLENRDKSRPYMLFVGYYAPHSPHNPPADYFNRYYAREDLDEPIIADYDVPPATSGHFMSPYVNLSGENYRATRAGYYGNIAFMDSQIGRLIAAAGQNTYIIFTSDHGDMLGDHYMYQKHRVYEGSSHIPLMISGPGIPDSQSIDAPVGWHDIMPTILDLAGLPIPESVDGKSMAPMLMGKEYGDWRDYLHINCVHLDHGAPKGRVKTEKHNLFDEKASHALTDGKMKYVWHVTSGTEQLFNLEEDWKELYDLAGKPEWQEELELWRKRMVEELKNSEEGFSDGEKLIPGKEPKEASTAMEELMALRRSEGFQQPYRPQRDPHRFMSFEDQLMKR